MDLPLLKEQCFGLRVASTSVGYASKLIVYFESDQPDPDSQLKQDLSLWADSGPWRIVKQGQMLASLEFERAGELAAELLDGKTITDLRVGPLGDLTVIFDESVDLEVFASPNVFDRSSDSWTLFLSESCVYPNLSGDLDSSPRDEPAGTS